MSFPGTGRRHERRCDGQPETREGRGRRRGQWPAVRQRRRAAHRVPRAERGRHLGAAPSAARRPAATTRSTRTRWSASPPATSASRSRTCSPARRPSPSSSGDPVAVAKALRDFARTNPNLVVKGGVLGDKLLVGRRGQGARRRRSPRGAAGPPGRCHGRADAAVRRAAAGRAPQLRLRPLGAHRAEGRRARAVEPARAGGRAEPAAAEATDTPTRPHPPTRRPQPPSRASTDEAEAPAAEAADEPTASAADDTPTEAAAEATTEADPEPAADADTPTEDN